MQTISDLLVENPVVAAIRQDADLESVLQSRVKIVFVLYGSILTIPQVCGRLIAAGKTVFIHVDMLDGLKGDAAGLTFLKQNACPQGIVSTRPGVIRAARQLGFATILRVFILDSLSLKTGIKNIGETGTDAVEIMPGVACRVIAGMERQIGVPVIAGGLILNKEQVLETLAQGAVAISTSARELWEL